jgi:hypothetical protein
MERDIHLLKNRTKEDNREIKVGFLSVLMSGMLKNFGSGEEPEARG